jgi:hypothetical protein
MSIICTFALIAVEVQCLQILMLFTPDRCPLLPLAIFSLKLELEVLDRLVDFVVGGIRFFEWCYVDRVIKLNIGFLLVNRAIPLVILLQSVELLWVAIRHSPLLLLFFGSCWLKFIWDETSPSVS